MLKLLGRGDLIMQLANHSDFLMTIVKRTFSNQNMCASSFDFLTWFIDYTLSIKMFLIIGKIVFS